MPAREAVDWFTWHVVALAAHDVVLQCWGTEGQEFCGLFADLPVDALSNLNKLQSWSFSEPGGDC